MDKCKCGKASVYYKRNEKMHYCRQCFIRMFEKKVRKTISRHKMLKARETIVVGLSGGKDSSVTLYILRKLIKPELESRLIAVSIDEGIDGYREKTLIHAKSLCKSLGVEHRIFSFKDLLGITLDSRIMKAKKEKGWLPKEACTYCGIGRRYALNIASKKLKADKLFTGHNLDDEVQAIMMNYVRGDLTRASRMGPITELTEGKKEIFIPRYKPLRNIPEKEITLYAILKGIEYGDHECPYANGIRFDVRDFINSMETKYPGTKYAIIETFDRILPGIKDAVKPKENKIIRCKRCGEPGSSVICKTCELWRAT